MDGHFDVVSVGDCVGDCLFYVNRMPKMGETMMANNFVYSPGGKGANSCVASAKLGSKSSLISKLGDDMFGKNFHTLLAKENINIEHVHFSNKAPTSVASIMVDNNGHNYIAVNFGATHEMNEKDVDDAEELIKTHKILITTMMIKPNVALHALKTGKKNNLITIFNFAPAIKDLDQEFNKYVDILVVNEVEAEVFTGSDVKNEKDAEIACQNVLAREGFYIGVIVTLGDKGCIFGEKKTGKITNFPARKVNVVDTTGAGDAFVGSLAHFIGKLGLESIYKAIDLATEYASLSVQSKGTQASYPYLNDIEEKFKI